MSSLPILIRCVSDMSHQLLILYRFCIVPQFCPLKEFCETLLSQDAELWVSALNAARDIANGKVPAHALAAKIFFKQAVKSRSGFDFRGQFRSMGRFIFFEV